MVKVANNVSMISGLGFGWSLLLLREFNWDETQVQYQYYNITENIHIKIGYTKEYSEPEQVRREVYGTCDVCLEPDREMIFNICNHCYCLDCWVYSITQKNNPFFDCMEVGCGVPVLAETVIGILSLAKNGKELTSKYHRMLCEHFCSTNDKYKFCTGTNCQNVIKVNRSGLEVVKCNCGTVFCFICQNEDHSPCNC